MSGILILALLGCANPTITGTILDFQGAPVVAARVTVEGTTLSALSDDKGAYALPFVPGMFRMTVEKDGFLSLGRQLLVTEGRPVPLAPLSLYARVAGATVTALTPTGPVAVDLIAPETPQGLGLQTLPSLALPADTWGLVVVQSKERSSALESLFRDDPTPKENARLLRLHVQVVEQRRGWAGAAPVPVNLWTQADVVPTTPIAVEGADPASFVLRPDATLEDGAYALPIQVERSPAGGSTLRWAAFIVGEVEKIAEVLSSPDEFEGD